jgi:hypothetical protein
MPGIMPCGVCFSRGNGLLGYGCVTYPGVLTLASYTL